MRIIFMGTPDFAVPVLDALVQAGHEIMAVVAQPDKPRGRGKKLQSPATVVRARELGLGDYLVLGGGELKSGGFRRDSILADALEAIIGAILLDGGESPCRKVVLDWFDERLRIITPQSAQKDAKTRLQEWLQARKFELPTYQVTQVEGLAPKQTFEVTCELEQMQQTFKAQGASRRKAEQQVAATVLSWLEQQYD